MSSAGPALGSVAEGSLAQGQGATSDEEEERTDVEDPDRVDSHRLQSM